MYRIRLEQFEGPLDLLLFFIQRDELDIYDIPIAAITDEFLEYVRLMEMVDLDGVGDFMYMAAVLINIKARMLLPRQETDDDGEPIDPRRELVERLLEYIRFKEASQHLHGQREEREQFFTRGAAGDVSSPFRVQEDVLTGDRTLFDLIQALRRVLTEAEEAPVYDIEQEAFTIEAQIAFVRTHVPIGERCGFRSLMEARTKPFIIATFLAILELARLGRVRVVPQRQRLDFEVEGTAPPDMGDHEQTDRAAR